jgi:phospholipid/cholesterol/gamma-HCH transport system ATP-binding protein
MATQPILEIESACVAESEYADTHALDFRLMPGELALIDADEPSAEWFADLCLGLIPLRTGLVRFLGHDWTATPPDYAAALRGSIGRVFRRDSWLGFLDTATNILLARFHHTHTPPEDLRAAAVRLAEAFGLPGLPLDPPHALAPLDLARAACVRVFLGDPVLLLLEHPCREEQFDALATHLLEALADARQRGAAAIWLTRSARVWSEGSVRADHRLVLHQHGLFRAAGSRPS